MIIGLVAMYMPKAEEVENIRKYINDLDYCYLLDDSAVDNSNVVQPLLEQFGEKVEYFMNPQNMGLCASVNNGFQMAIQKGADWILIMNPDGTFQNDALAIFKKFIKENKTDDVDIIAPRFNIDRRKKRSGEGYKEIKYPDMTGCLYNTKILKKLGFYDQNTYKGELTEELMKEAEGDSKVHFIGLVTDEELKAYLSTIDIYCFPSITKNEAFGVALAEAMYYSKPAITFTIPGSGVNYVSIDGITGVEVENRNVEKYAEAMKKLAANKELREKYGKAGRERVIENFLN